MAMINYADKVALNQNSNIADINKVKADDMNELKNAFNNQVAQGWYKTGVNPTFTFVSYDSSTLTGVVSSDLDMTPYLNVGMKVKFTQSSAIKYAFITAITSTQLTLFLGTDYLINSSAISNTYFSMLKAPYGFPLNPNKWSIFYSDANYRSQASPTSGTWYNINSASLSVPIGLWKIGFFAMIGGYNASAGTKNLSSTLSTSNNSQSDKDLTNIIDGYGIDFKIYQSAEKIISLDVKTTFYLLTSTVTGGMTEIRNWGGGANPPNTIYCKCAYL